MIYAIGLDTDSTFIHFLKEATNRGKEVLAINLRAVIRAGDWQLFIPDTGNSFVSVAGERIPLDPQASYFCRVIDLASVQPEPEIAGLWRNLISGLNSWLEHIPGIVINRPGGHTHNSSKPLHEEYLRQSGFDVPVSLTSSDRNRLLKFVREGKTILKTVSGIRANSRLVDPEKLGQLGPVLGPVHLQRYISGVDVRAHVVGTTVHAELIGSDAVDYRNTSNLLDFSPHHLPDKLTDKIVRTTKRMGLIFAGWDFKLSSNDQYWCLEANPMPGYDGYDRRLGGRITDSLLKLLLDPTARN